MIDYTELPDDGILFEQLVRELLLREGFDVHWTGVGPDAGRDLMVTEKACGGIAEFNRQWLVSCKHFANSKGGRSVGVSDVDGIVDACRAVNAQGFLLVCSTQPSSALVRRLEEIQIHNQIATKIWDGIELEKRLSTPSTFPLIYQFFPRTAKSIGWRIYNTNSPSFWAANFKDYFIYLSSRTANTFPGLKDVETILDKLESIKLPQSGKGIEAQWKKQYVRPRAIYFDNKHEQFYVFADYLVPHDCDADNILTPKDFDAVLQDGQGLYHDESSMWYITFWDIKIEKTTPTSDHFHLDHKDYYEKYINNYKIGLSRGSWTIGDMKYWY